MLYLILATKMNASCVKILMVCLGKENMRTVAAMSVSAEMAEAEQ